MRHRRSSEESIWAPLADTMTLAACVFLLIFIASIIKYRQAEEKVREAQVAELERQKVEMERSKRLESQVVEMRQMRTAVVGALASLEITGAQVTPEGVLQLEEGVLFDRGRSDLKPEGQKFVREKLAVTLERALQTPGHRILIAGHTDDRPIQTSRFPSNWELSSARATTVLRAVLDASPSIPPDRIFAAGFAEHHPVKGTAPGDDVNRRVEIRVEPDTNILFLEAE